MVAAAKMSAAEALDEGRYFSTDDVLSVTRCSEGVEHVGIQSMGKIHVLDMMRYRISPSSIYTIYIYMDMVIQ